MAGRHCGKPVPTTFEFDYHPPQALPALFELPCRSRKLTIRPDALTALKRMLASA